MGNPPDSLGHFLAAYRRQRLLVVALVALAALLSGLSLFTWLSVSGRAWLGDSLPLRWFLFLAWWGALLAWTGFTAVCALRLAGSPWSLARDLAQRIGDHRLRLLSAVQFRQGTGGWPIDSAVSQHLARAHIEQVEAELAGQAPVRLVPWRRLALPGAMALVLGGATLLSSWIWPGPFSAGFYRLWSWPHPGQSPAESSGPPWVGDIQIAYRYPDYAGRQDRRVVGSDGSVLALAGTQITLQAQSDRPLSAGLLRIGEQVAPLTISDERHLTAQWVVMQPGSYRFELTATDGSRWQSPHGVPIHIEPDHPPRVEMTRPDRDAVVKEDDAIDIHYQARDDFGLEQIRLVWRVLGRLAEPQHQVEKRLDPTRVKQVRHAFRWDLAGLRLNPGEQVQCYLEALDNDTVNGPKIGRSHTVTLKVFSADEHHRELMDQARQQWEQLLLHLADHLSGSYEHGSDWPDLKGQQNLLTALGAIRAGLARVVQQLGQDSLTWAPLLDGLANVLNRLAGIEQGFKWALRRAGRRDPLPADARRSLAAEHDRRERDLERDILFLEDLLDLERLQDLERIAADLATARNRLGDLMERFRQAPNAQIRQQIEAEIARLKQRMAELLARQSEVLKSVHDEYFNPQALKKAFARQDVMSALDRLQSLMNEGDLDGAMAELAQLQQRLQNLQNALERTRAGFGSERYQELARRMAGLQSELNQVVEEQKRIHEATEGIRQGLIEKLAQRARSQQQKIQKDLLQHLKQLMTDLSSIPPQILDQLSSMDRERALENARGLQQLLKALELVPAREVAGQLEMETERVTEGLEGQRLFHGRDPASGVNGLQRHLRRAHSAHDHARHIHDLLKKVLPDEESLLSNGDRKRLDNLQQRQTSLQGRVESMRQEMEGLNQKAPLFGQDLLGGVGRSRYAMQRSAQELKRRAPRQAAPHQQRALAELERLQQNLEKNNRQGGGAEGMPLPLGSGLSPSGRSDRPGSGPPDLEEVQLPSPEDHQSPEAFRKALLDGMKDPVPEEFKPQVRKYYEELVK